MLKLTSAAEFSAAEDLAKHIISTDSVQLSDQRLSNKNIH